MFDNYRDSVEGASGSKRKKKMQMTGTNISVQDMSGTNIDKAKIQFPAYMNHFYGDVVNQSRRGGPVKVPNLTLFPKKNINDVSEEVKKKYQSGMIGEVSVSHHTLPAVSHREYNRDLASLGTGGMAT